MTVGAVTLRMLALGAALGAAVPAAAQSISQPGGSTGGQTPGGSTGGQTPGGSTGGMQPGTPPPMPPAPPAPTPTLPPAPPPPPSLTTAQQTFGWLPADLAAQALSGAIGGAIGQSFGIGGPRPPGFAGPTGFAPERAGIGVVEEAFAALGYSKADGAPAAAPAATPWHVWTEVRGTRLDAEVSGTDLATDQLNAMVGVDRQFGDLVVVGVVGGYENTRNRLPGLPAWVDGEGWSVGPYLGLRLGPRTVLEASVLYTQLDYDARNLFTSGSFDAERVTGLLGLVQTWTAGIVSFEPSLRGYVVHEEQAAYVDTLGRPQERRDVTVYGAMAGAQVSAAFAVAGGVSLVPSLGAYLDWREVEQDSPTLGQPSYAVNDGASGRVTAGLAGRSERWSLSAGGSAGSLGSGDHVVWTWHGQASLRF